MAKAKKVSKASPAKTAALKAVADAKSDAEKKLARSNLKIINFKELAVPRVNKVLTAMEQLQRLSNRSSYTFDDAQVAKIFAALETKGKELHAAFSNAGTPGAPKFDL